MQITFLGATGTVTGSKYLIQAASKKILIDCGLFQGFKQFRLRNWAPLPVDPKQIDAVILTHAHLDHTGYLPLLVKNGFAGKIYCTAATEALCEILLPDSGHLQEEEAEYANKRGFSKHTSALPLYTTEDALRSLRLFTPVKLTEDIDLGGGLSFRLSHSGHLLGSAFVLLRDDKTTILFSGDLGRPNDPIMLPPAQIESADYVVVESTYGNRRHSEINPQDKIAEIVNRTIRRNGVVIIPAFAVGRAQTLLYHFHRLRAHNAIPDIPIYLNSPMAVNAGQIFHKYRSEHRLSAKECDATCSIATVVNSVEESKRLNQKHGPMIIISASGMATGGRVLHHLKAFAPDARNTILFAGYQAGGTRGAAMLNGAEAIKIHGDYVAVRAEVDMLDNLSGHADWMEILGWLNGFRSPPRETFITHGESAAADALRLRIEENLKWRCQVPEYLQSIELT